MFGCAHVFVLLSIVIVLLPVVTTSRLMLYVVMNCQHGHARTYYPWHSTVGCTWPSGK